MQSKLTARESDPALNIITGVNITVSADCYFLGSVITVGSSWCTLFPLF